MADNNDPYVVDLTCLSYMDAQYEEILMENLEYRASTGMWDVVVKLLVALFLALPYFFSILYFAGMTTTAIVALAAGSACIIGYILSNVAIRLVQSKLYNAKVLTDIYIYMNDHPDTANVGEMVEYSMHKHLKRD